MALKLMGWEEFIQIPAALWPSSSLFTISRRHCMPSQPNTSVKSLPPKRILPIISFSGRLAYVDCYSKSNHFLNDAKNPPSPNSPAASQPPSPAISNQHWASLGLVLANWTTILNNLVSHALHKQQGLLEVPTCCDCMSSARKLDMVCSLVSQKAPLQTKGSFVVLPFGAKKWLPLAFDGVFLLAQ